MLKLQLTTVTTTMSEQLQLKNDMKISLENLFWKIKIINCRQLVNFLIETEHSDRFE